MKHAVISRCRFANRKLMDKYLAVSAEYLVPQLQKQKAPFDWFIISNKADGPHITKYLGCEFRMIQNREELAKIMVGYNIQTRHDIDDWMSENYIEMIQALYKQVIGSLNRFVIHAQPVQLNILTNREYEMRKYRCNNTSMFVSLCQKTPEYNIFSKKHNQLWRIAEKTFMLKGTPVKWIIHGNNITCKRNLNKTTR